MSGNPTSRPRRRWLQVSLRSLLLLTLLVCTFLAGRHSLQTEVDHVRAKAKKMQKQAEQIRKEAEQTRIQIQSQQQIFQAPSRWQMIEEGMKADALERQMMIQPRGEVIPR